MKKYFISSDIHGFYKEWRKALAQSGFEINNPEHILIVLGDIFDRGKEPWKVYKFITSFPEERMILIKGNHEYLLLELVKRKMPFEHDIHNGTYDTLISLYKDPEKERIKWVKDNKDKYVDEYQLYRSSFETYRRVEKKLYDNKKINEIVDFINSSRWLDYFELGKYIFVHSFIPLQLNDVGVENYYPDWRNTSTEQMWEDATWRCPYKMYQLGHFIKEEKNGKILVCGHWYSSDFYNNLLYPNNKEKWLDMKKENPIFKSPLYPGIIGIDACVGLTKKINILLIDENEINV